jgi:hypothetical protein
MRSENRLSSALRMQMVSSRCGVLAVVRVTLLTGLATMVSAAGAYLALPARAGAYATVGPAPTAGPSGLPDGRIYEEVSPANKYGNGAGDPLGGPRPVMVAAADGDSVFFNTSGGPVGESGLGNVYWAVAQRSPTGWSSSVAVPRGPGGQGVFNDAWPRTIALSADLSETLFTSQKAYFPEQGAEQSPDYGPNIYLAGADGSPAWQGPPTWIGKPSVSSPRLTQENGMDGVAGASADLSHVFFAWPGTLVEGDETPDAALGGLTRSVTGAEGFFEWDNGTLSYAGTLPNGSIDAYGAVPAAGRVTSSDSTRNQVSTDGSRAFFVSPAPGSAAPATDPVELYVHETAVDGAQRTVLVSRDALLAPVAGLPAAAPHGPVSVMYPPEPNPSNPELGIRPSYMYASPDGSRVFFESADRLTAAAPGDNTIKEYEFDVSAETLTYLPGVTAGTEQATSPILASTSDGSRLLFEKNTEDPGEAVELELWSEGPAGGQVTPVVQLAGGGQPGVWPVRASSTGAVFVFQTSASLAGFDSGGYSQIYRYDAAINSLSCVSCPPAGIVPTGPASLTHDDYPYESLEMEEFFNSSRGISEDGSRVFFDTPDALVPQDTNGLRDVYEWENGRVYLISTGASTVDSFVGDNSANGSDVVFSTKEGLVPGDADEDYDVYDARIPHPGDNPPPTAVPCQGEVCQGPPSVPALLGTPASATFNGLGNTTGAEGAAIKKAVTKKSRPKAKKKPKRKAPRKRKGRGHKSISKRKGKR